MKRIILTGGGTAGHVTPHLALLPTLSARGFDLHYVGQAAGIEQHLIAPAGIPFYGIRAGKLRRYFDVKNFRDLLLLGAGFVQSLLLVRKLRPHIVFSKGGYVACPVVWAAWLQRVPVIIHESDLTPGLANQLSMPFAAHICFSFPETAAQLPKGKSTQTGIPIRATLRAGDAAQGRTLCGFTAAKPVVLMIGGSQGAEAINQAIRAGLPELLQTFQVCHLCGPGKMRADFAAMPGYVQWEYVTDELPHLLALADVVVSRAGATTLFELLALQKPHLLIPLSRRASRGDQLLNAQAFAQQGFSDVLPEEQLTAATLLAGITRAYAGRPARMAAMRAAAAVNGVENVLAVIERYCLPQDR